VIATDVDGTLVGEGSPVIAPEYFQAIRDLTLMGVRVAAFTGRHIDSVRLLFEPVKELVDENGAASADMVPGMAIQAAVMGSEAHHPLLQACMEYYQNRPFVREDGSLSNELLAPHIYALQARSFGFRYQNRMQQLEEGTVLYPSNEFAPAMWESTRTSRMIHLCAGSWREIPQKTKRSYERDLRLAVRKRQIRVHILNRKEEADCCE